MTAGRRLAAGPALGAVAALTLRRLRRGRALRVAAAIAALPVAYALAGSPRVAGSRGTASLVLELLLFAVLPPMLVAASIGEELEDRTGTYLWSRPIPRWTIVVGKLAVLGPLAAAMLAVSWLVAARLGDGAFPPARAVLALGAGALAAAAVAAGLALLAPRHALAVATAYLLFFDLPVGELPVSLRQLSVSHHTLALSGLKDGDGGAALLALALLGGGWLVVGLRRLRRLEP